MNKDAVQKTKATRNSKKKRFASQVINIGEDWVILRADELNWEVRYQDRFCGYFGTIVGAFQSLPAKMLGEAAKNSLQQVIEAQRAISETITASLAMKLAV